MPNCLFPGCPRNSDPGSGHCIFHKKHYSNSVSVKVKKEIPKESDKEKERKKELKKMYPVFLSKPENKFCKVKMEGCTKIATVIHHVRGRIGDQVFEVKDWLPSCASCNIVLEAKDQEARAKGIKKSKFHK